MSGFLAKLRGRIKVLTPDLNYPTELMGQARMWAELRQALPKRFIEPIARVLSRTRLTPNALTILGFLLSVGTAMVIARGYLFASGLLILFSGLFDTLDGALARVSGKTTRFGALLDSTLDRYSEAALLAGLLWFFMTKGLNTQIVLVYVTIVGSLLVSYIRARAEGLGLQCKIGILTRTERVIILALGLLLNQLDIMLWILAILTNLTVGQRLLHIWQQTKNKC